MKVKIFDPDAPWTVRAGAVCLAVLSVVDFAVSFSGAWSDGGARPGPWHAVFRPVIGLSAGLGWAWGVVYMLGVFYWGWVIMVMFAAVVAGVMMALSVSGTDFPIASHTWTLGDGIGLALVLATFVLLVSKPSLQAFWRHGRLSPRKSTEIA